MLGQAELRQQRFAFGGNGRVVAHRLPPAVRGVHAAGHRQRQALQRRQLANSWLIWKVRTRPSARAGAAPGR
jgi:hypothetical protein